MKSNSLLLAISGRTAGIHFMQFVRHVVSAWGESLIGVSFALWQIPTIPRTMPQLISLVTRKEKKELGNDLNATLPSITLSFISCDEVTRVMCSHPLRLWTTRRGFKTQQKGCNDIIIDGPRSSVLEFGLLSGVKAFVAWKDNT